MAENVSIEGTWYLKEKCKFNEKLGVWELIESATPVAIPPKAITSPAENPLIDSTVLSAVVAPKELKIKSEKEEEKMAVHKKKNKSKSTSKLTSKSTSKPNKKKRR